jgi:Ribonuclease HepT-like
MEADQVGRLRDILESARLIGTYVKDTVESDFRNDRQKQDAVIRRIEIIGEATAHLSEATRQSLRPLRRTLTTLAILPAQARATPAVLQIRKLPLPPLRPSFVAIRSARSLPLCLRAASLPPSKARPTTCVAIPGSALPTAQAAFTTA